MKIEFGDIEIKIPYEKYLVKFSRGENPFETMFSKPNMDFFNELYKKVSPNMINYFEECSKLMEKYTQMGKPE